MKLKKLLSKAYISFMKITARLFSKTNKNQVLFISFSGKSYSDNPKAISEALHNAYPKINIVWLIKDAENKHLPAYITRVDYKDVYKRYKAYFSSRVIVSNFELPNIKKSKQQFFIQTWHGDRAFKKVLYATSFFKKRKIMESQEGFCNLAIAGSKYGENQYRTAFKYQGEVMLEGTPRDDMLVNPSLEKQNAIKKFLNVNNDVKILLFAPTLRSATSDNRTNQEVILDIDKTISMLEEKYKTKWICLLRAHPAIVGLANISYNDKIINVDDYEDMADLLLISDFLITDYSSCAGDFALLNKPIVLYQADIDDYISTEREFYFNMSDSPYFIADSMDSLEKIISALDEESVNKNCRDILDFYQTSESGNASYAVADRIIEWIKQ